MPRPKSDNPRDIAVTVHLNQEEYDIITEYTKVPSAFMRDSALHMIEMEQTYSEYLSDEFGDLKFIDKMSAIMCKCRVRKS